MADDLENDDQWLYGDNPDLNLTEPTQESQLEDVPSIEPSPELLTKPPQLPPENDERPPGVDDEVKENEEEQLEEAVEEDGEVRQNGGEDSDKDLDDESDDDINVVIGDIKTTPSYTSLNIKRSGLLTAPPAADKSKTTQQSGKFSIEEFDLIGTINGVPATEYNLDSLEDKPWRKPGADITDYFNYGFNEDTWRAYCERQKRMRVNESGVGLAPMNPIGLPRGPIPIMNDNSKYSGNFLGGAAQRTVPPQTGKVEPPKMNTIQVMTADRREYSRKPTGFPDMSVPPPTAFEEFQPEYGFNPEPEPFYGGYEPTQDSQWGEANAGWTPSDIKSLTPGPQMGPPPHLHMGPPPIGMPIPSAVPPVVDSRRESPRREGREHDKDRESSRSRSEKPRERDRERSHRRERSRSRSRRHKSRSRSPGHRSHRKKKSRRHDDSD